MDFTKLVLQPNLTVFFDGSVNIFSSKLSNNVNFKRKCLINFQKNIKKSNSIGPKEVKSVTNYRKSLFR